MSRRRFPRRPFVVTVAAAVASSAAFAACGGQTAGSATGGTAGTDSGAAGAAGASGSAGSSGADSGTGDAAGASGGAGAPADAGDGAAPCPPDPPDFGGTGWDACNLAAGKTCHYDMTCQSGAVSLDFECDAYGAWRVAGATTCPQPYDSCPGTSLRCVPGTGWGFDVNYNYNPPGPCPTTAPSAGDACQPGGFGGDPDACGYPCTSAGPASGWTVLRCDFGDGGTPASAWTSDNACSADT